VIDIFGVGAGRGALPSHDRRDMVDITILVARRSALADLSTICVTIASRLVSLRRPPSVDRHDDPLVQRIGQQCRKALGVAAAGVAGLPLLEAGVQRRPARPPGNRCRYPPWGASSPFRSLHL
jgi:hypothetical protein